MILFKIGSRNDYYLDFRKERICRFDGLSIFRKYVVSDYLSVQRYAIPNFSIFIKEMNKIHNFNSSSSSNRDII